MILRILPIILLLIVLPDAYIYMHLLRHDAKRKRSMRWLWWLPTVGMLVYTGWMAQVTSFVPANSTVLYTYFLLLTVVVVPKVVYAVCEFLGWRHCVYHHTIRNWGHSVGLVLAPIVVVVLLYGFTFGFSRLKVRHVDLYFDDLPAALDGTRIVHISDIHVGTFSGARQWILQRDIDSINAQRADFVCFTGDLQNVFPAEIAQADTLLRQIKAREGVFAVLGNHDYSFYQHADSATSLHNERLTRKFIARLGWRLLDNEAVKAQLTDSISGDTLAPIIFVGTANALRPAHSDYRKAFEGVARDSMLVVHLQHNPKVWADSTALVATTAQPHLTLSGHTHAGQMSFLGYRPTMIQYPFDYGLHRSDSLAGGYLYVTSGLGGVVPFRLGAPAEIVVITIHAKKK